MSGFFSTVKELFFAKSDNSTIVGLSQLKEKRYVEPEPKKVYKKSGEVKISDLIRGN